GLGVAVLAAEVGPRGVAGAVAVLDPGLRLVHRARAHVHADVRLGAEDPAVLDELVGTEAVRLLGVPGQLRPPGALFAPAHAVQPVVAADEVAPRPAEDGHPQRPDGVEHVAPEAPGVGQRRALVEDAAVDAAPEVLDEVAEDAAVHGADPPRGVDDDPRHG